MLLAMDGITTTNYRSVLDHANSIFDLAQCDSETLQSALGSTSGFRLYNFFNESFI